MYGGNLILLWPIRSLRFYWRTSLAVLLAVAVCTGILTGALVVGDSVRYSLARMVDARLGATGPALVADNRFFRSQLADDLEADLNTVVAPVLRVRGLIANDQGTRRVNRVEVLGVDERFYRLGGSTFAWSKGEGLVLNRSLAERLRVGEGDEVVVRIAKPGLMPREVPLAPTSGLAVAGRLVVTSVAGESDFGSFSLQANQIAPMNVFVPIDWLQKQLGRPGQANMLLVAEHPRQEISVKHANQAISRCWRLADAGLELRGLSQVGAFEIRSNRIFIDESLSGVLLEAGHDATGVLTYFVNELRLGDKATPYSTVTALDVPAGIGEDEIAVNEWLAEDLGAKVGDRIEIVYFVLSPMRRLVESKRTFVLHSVVPMTSAVLDPDLMPDYPGLAEVENCREWDSTIPIDMGRVRKQDEDYWKKYRGTPKAIIALKAGQRLWANRYGNLTAVRYRGGEAEQKLVTERVLRQADPASVGLLFQPVRRHGVTAADQAMDFGQLFLGMSMFLIAAAVILTGLVFVFGVESRSQQVGVLLAMGLSPRLVKGLFLLEGAILAVVGAVVGVVAGLLYCRIMILALATIWREVVTGAPIWFHAEASSLFVGACGASVISLLAIWLSLRRQFSRPARELLAGSLGLQLPVAQFGFGRRVTAWLGMAAVIAAGGILVTVGGSDASSASVSFFGAGVLLLTAGLLFLHAGIRLLGTGGAVLASPTGLALRNLTRRSGRSMAVAGVLACGVFLTIAIGANRKSPLSEPLSRGSGTGGFAFFGESAIGISTDLNAESVRESLGLDREALKGVRIVQMRVHEGDDASCLNLNRAQSPQILGVSVEQFQNRGAFSFTHLAKDADPKSAWNVLAQQLGEDVVPAVGDYPTVYWSLGKKVGDEIPFTDEMGRQFRLRIVGMLKSSVLQGSLLISEEQFVRLFPSEDGYRAFLVDAPPDRAEQVAEQLSSRLQDFGLSVTPTVERLAAFSAVENSYLSVFQLLGGLALAVGSIGLALVVLRNMLERRGELAMLRSVGFGSRAIKKMVLYEHSAMVLYGLACGTVAALIAIGPALGVPSAGVPYVSIGLTIAAIAGGGVLWIWLATALALRSDILEALRNE